MRLKTGALVALYLAAIVVANLLVTAYGPSVIYWNAFGLIALDFVTRDRLADFWGTKRWLKMILLIAAGGALSWFVNRDAATVALASCVAFASAEAVEMLLYHALRRRRWLERAPLAAILPAAIDSLIFPWIAFGGVMWSVSGKQWLAKMAGVALWTLVAWIATRPPRVAPEAA